MVFFPNFGFILTDFMFAPLFFFCKKNLKFKSLWLMPIDMNLYNKKASK